MKKKLENLEFLISRVKDNCQFTPIGSGLLFQSSSSTSYFNVGILKCFWSEWCRHSNEVNRMGFAIFETSVDLWGLPLGFTVCLCKFVYNFQKVSLYDKKNGKFWNNLGDTPWLDYLGRIKESCSTFNSLQLCRRVASIWKFSAFRLITKNRIISLSFSFGGCFSTTRGPVFKDSHSNFLNF